MGKGKGKKARGGNDAREVGQSLTSPDICLCAQVAQALLAAREELCVLQLTSMKADGPGTSSGTLQLAAARRAEARAVADALTAGVPSEAPKLLAARDKLRERFVKEGIRLCKFMRRQEWQTAIHPCPL